MCPFQLASRTDSEAKHTHMKSQMIDEIELLRTQVIIIVIID